MLQLSPLLRSSASAAILLAGYASLGTGRVVFEAGMGCVRIVDQSGACHDEASLWGVGFRSGDQVFRAIEIGSPDGILIPSPENGGKMNDRRNALHGLLQRIPIQKIAFDGTSSSGDFLARPYERTAVYAGIDEPPQKPRTYESRSTSN